QHRKQVQPHVAGESYRICTDGRYLESPWTYHALRNGIRSYTVSQYDTLRGHGTALPPLPPYIARQAKKAEAAIIFAPGAPTSAPSDDFPGSPLLYFFEGGRYGGISYDSVPGDVFIGGSAPGYPEPVFSGSGIDAQNDSWDFSGGGSTLASAASPGTTTITTRAPISGYITTLTFAGGPTYNVVGRSGTRVTLSPRLATAESAGTVVWANVQAPIGHTTAAARRGARVFHTGPMDLPVVPWEYLDIGATNGAVDTLQVSTVTGSPARGYTLGLAEPASVAAAANAPVYYSGPSGDVTVEYLDIAGGGGDTTLAVQVGGGLAASGWTIEHNDFHDNYAGGADYRKTSSAGQAIAGADHATIEYNCFQRLGEYALNGGGTGTKFDYNQVDETPYQPDLSGNGQSGCAKWWATRNNDVVDNAFTDEIYSTCVWFDNGNTGMLVKGNFFYNIGGRAVQNETGYDSRYIGNLFEDTWGGIYLNDSGAWDIPGSRYNDEVVVKGNTFYNVIEAIDIWGASGRSCLNSGESAPNGETAPYCSGGYPQDPPLEEFFSHYQDSTVGGTAIVERNEACSSAAPCSTVLLSDAPALLDWIGFAGQAPDSCPAPSSCKSHPHDPVETSSNDKTEVSRFKGSGTITVTSTTGFPSSGQLIVSTSAGSLNYATGAVVSYTGHTTTSFTGVELISGSGRLAGAIEAVQPYHVAAVSCPGGNCLYNTVVRVSPAITADLAAGTIVYSTGTCPYYVTTAATPTSPRAPDGTSYYDGCMWEERNISVTHNTFEVDPAQFDSTPLPEETGRHWTCRTGPAGNCADNAMGYQYPGGDAAPYNDVVLANAMMSARSLPSPLRDLNAPRSPLATGKRGDVAPNGDAPYDDVWSANTYLGDWTFQAYTQAAACPLDWTGHALEWVGGDGDACSGLSLAQWQKYWDQD
ncbi:MAG: hypothetical protein ACRDZX_01160, partial [Acidimicrobiales bacterium]